MARSLLDKTTVLGRKEKPRTILRCCMRSPYAKHFTDRRKAVSKSRVTPHEKQPI